MASLGKYDILCPLREGAAPRNFLAFHTGVGSFSRLVVMRLLADDRVADDSLPARLLGAARECAGFSHPYVASAFEPEVIDGRLYLVTEFTPGATLAEAADACRAANQRLPLGFVLRAARDAAFALHYAHTFSDSLGRKRPVVHGALTDQSVLVTFEGTTKVVDFAHPREPARQGSVFASPEQVRGEALDGRADLFSLGAVLHSLVTGRRFQYAEVLGRAPSKAEFPPPSEVNPEATSQLDVCLMRALYPNRDSRYGTALEFARDLERVAAPLLFAPEQSGALVQHLFGARREQLRTLVGREEEDARTAVHLPPVEPDAGAISAAPTRRPSISINAQPAMTPAVVTGERERTVQLRRPKPPVEAPAEPAPPNAGEAGEEFDPGTAPAHPPVVASVYDDDDQATVQIGGPALAAVRTEVGMQAVSTELRARRTPSGREVARPATGSFAVHAVPPTGRYDVVPSQSLAAPTQRTQAVADDRPVPLGAEPASPTAQFRAALFDDIAATASVPRPKLDEEPGGANEAFANGPTRSEVSEPPRKRRLGVKLLVALVGLTAVGLGAAWVIAPARLAQAYASVLGRAKGPVGRTGSVPGPVARAVVDAGVVATAAPDAAAEPLVAVDAGAAEPPDAGAQAVVDAGTPKPAKAAKAPGKPAKKKRKR